MGDQPREGDYVTTTEAAELAAVPVGTIRSWASRGKLFAVGTVNGVRYYAAAEVLRVEAATRRRPRLKRITSALTRDLQ
jgi:DNA-binding transcriptional MerR regulator